MLFQQFQQFQQPSVGSDQNASPFPVGPGGPGPDADLSGFAAQRAPPSSGDQQPPWMQHAGDNARNTHGGPQRPQPQQAQAQPQSQSQSQQQQPSLPNFSSNLPQVDPSAMLTSAQSFMSGLPGGASSAISGLTTFASSMPAPSSSAIIGPGGPGPRGGSPGPSGGGPSSSSSSSSSTALSASSATDLMTPTGTRPTSCGDSDYECQFKQQCWDCYSDHSLVSATNVHARAGMCVHQAFVAHCLSVDCSFPV